MKKINKLFIYSLLSVIITSCQNKDDSLSFKENLKVESIRSVLEKSDSKKDSVLIQQTLYSNPEEFGFEKLTTQKEDYPSIEIFDVYIRQLRDGKEEFLLKRKNITLNMRSGSYIEVRSDLCTCSGTASDIAPDYFNDLCPDTPRGGINLLYTMSGFGYNITMFNNFWSMSYGRFETSFPDPSIAEMAIEAVPDGWLM